MKRMIVFLKAFLLPSMGYAALALPWMTIPALHVMVAGKEVAWAHDAPGRAAVADFALKAPLQASTVAITCLRDGINVKSLKISCASGSQKGEAELPANFKKGDRLTFPVSISLPQGAAAHCDYSGRAALKPEIEVSFP